MRWSTLLPEPADNRTRDAMLRLFYAQSGVSLAAAALLVVLLCGYAWERVPQPLLLGWAGAFALLLVVRAQWRRVVQRLDDAALAASAAKMVE